MMIKKIFINTIFLLGLTGTAWGQNINVTNTFAEDSSLICKIIKSNPKNPAEAAKNLIGVPYVAHTLEGNKMEQLVINLQAVDCTTFVENAMALYMARGKDYNAYCKALSDIRYFDGIINGYFSRKHYVTAWVNDNVKNNILIDLTQKYGTTSLKTNLDFMSTHPYKYTQLCNKDSIIAIRHMEQKYSGLTIKYLPKKELPTGGCDWIKEGDIIGLVTTIKGLDVSHLGIATYLNGELHLMHASSILKKVIIDPRPLSEQINYKSDLGIRVLRIK